MKMSFSFGKKFRNKFELFSNSEKMEREKLSIVVGL